MPCKCVNDEGCPALSCDGTCSSARMLNPDIKERAMEDSFTGQQLRQLKFIVQDALSVSHTIEHVWMEGFIRGFKEGYEYGQ